MNTQQLLHVLFPTGGQKQLTADQENIVKHPTGPAWVLAGPGSGKTEVLSVLVLRLLYVENDAVQTERVPPESVVVTTFTDKAARRDSMRQAEFPYADRSWTRRATPHLSPSGKHIRYWTVVYTSEDGLRLEG